MGQAEGRAVDGPNSLIDLVILLAAIAIVGGLWWWRARQ
jgi:hypothetical protein